MLWTPFCPFDPNTDKQVSLISNSPMSPLRACLKLICLSSCCICSFCIIPQNYGDKCWSYMFFHFKKKSSYIWKCSSFYVLLCIPPTTHSKIATCAQTIHMAPGKSAPGLWEVQLRTVLRSDFPHHFWRETKLSKGNYTSASVCSSKVCVHTQEWT